MSAVPCPVPWSRSTARRDSRRLTWGGDLYAAAQRSLLDQLVAEQTEPFRLFLGHAGWGQGQLEREVQRGVWMTLPASEVEVFAPETELWPEAVRQVGAAVLRSAIPSRLIPPDPGWN